MSAGAGPPTKRLKQSNNILRAFARGRRRKLERKYGGGALQNESESLGDSPSVWSRGKAILELFYNETEAFL